MKTEVGRQWYQSIHFDELSCRQVVFSGPQWTPSREEQKSFQRPYYILTMSQPVGLVIFLSGQKLMCGFYVSVSVGKALMIKNARNKVKKKIRQLTFQHATRKKC